MKFNKEEIELCRKIAEKHRKDIEYGDWYCDSNYSNEIRLLHSLDRGKIHARSQKELNVFLLWTLSGCLEWLRDRDWNPYEMFWICEARVKISYIKPKEKIKSLELRADTLLEACLKAVLAVLEEES